jgi:DNA-binding LacI/PurR family transcriptional regulator
MKQSIYEAIAAKIRNEIGVKYRPGDMLPSARQLCKIYEGSYVTVCRALQLLEEKGYVKRFHGRGTVVVDPTENFEIALVVRGDLLDVDQTPYYPLTMNLISEELRRQKFSGRFKTLLGSPDMGDDVFYRSIDLFSEASRSRLKGVFTFQPLHDLEDDLIKNDIPVISFNTSGSCRVLYNGDNFYNDVFNSFKEKGCDNIGMLHVSGKFALREPDYHTNKFREKISGTGIKLNEGWTRYSTYKDGISSERNAFELFMQCFEENDKLPSVLLITDDIVCKGILRGILTAGVELPQDMKLITRSNKGISLPYHKEVTRFEHDPQKAVAEAVRIMLKAINKERVPQETFVSYDFIKGETF